MTGRSGSAYARKGGGGGYTQCVQHAFKGGGGVQKSCFLCVRTIWMAPYEGNMFYTRQLVTV